MKTIDKIFYLYLAITIAFVALLISPLSNYIEFYKAVENCQLKLYDAKLNTAYLRSDGIVYLSIEFNVSNPTNFRHLKVTTVTCNLYYSIPEFGNHKQLPGLTETFKEPIYIPPNGYSIIKVEFRFRRGSEHQAVKEFFNLLLTEPNKIDFLLEGQYVLYAYTYPFVIPMGPFTFSYEG